MILSRQLRQGFTIVELLIVIVIIAILAAITIVAYNGITNRANATSAKAAANAAIKKIEAYAADTSTTGGGDGSYPGWSRILTNPTAPATTSSIFYLTGVTFSDSATAPTTAPTAPSVLLYYNCGSNPGGRIDYWDYSSSSSNKWTAIYTGGGNSTNCTTYKRASATS